MSIERCEVELEGTAAIVTGAAQGMGKEFATELSAAGADVAICDINQKLLEETAAHLKSSGAKVLSGHVDVSDETQVNAFVGEAVQAFGRVDILVNNAAIHPLHTIEDISGDEWDRVLSINLKGYFLFVKAVLQYMRRQKFGRIINIASEAAKNGGTICAPHYAAAKGGVLSFTRNLAKHVGADGITVNAIAPGRIATAMAGAVSEEENQVFIDKSVVKRLGKPEDVANAVLFLASPRSGFVTGETLNINGGTLMD
jgi:3-oxoacyl-[acyl-carrier protein] reductase